MSGFRQLFGVMVLASSVAACGGPGGPEEAAQAAGKGDIQGEGGALSLLTYNAGLARGAVALAEQRIDPVLEALRREAADVVCLQEVWTDDDAARVQAALADLYPYSFRERTEDRSKKSVPCGPWQTFTLDRCVKKQCAPQGISVEECVAGACADRYGALPDECKRCLAANTASPTWCALWPGARPYAWEGRNGLLLLARRPILRPRYTAFDTLLVKRGMISAEVAGLAVHCTHLSADLPSVPYPEGRGAASWQQEQAEQVRWITAAAVAEPTACTVLLGDFNAGPQTAALAGEVPETMAALEAAGFSEPWAARRCTWCADNPLATGADRQLDHVLLRGCPELTVSYERRLDLPIEVRHDGDVLQTRLSDHYALRAELLPRAR